MPTFHSKEIIDELIKNNGCYETDPPCYNIFEYIHDTGQTLWAVDYDTHEEERLFSSPYVISYKRIWSWFDKKLETGNVF